MARALAVLTNLGAIKFYTERATALRMHTAEIAAVQLEALEPEMDLGHIPFFATVDSAMNLDNEPDVPENAEGAQSNE